MRRSLVLLCTLPLALLGAACGGDDDGGERLTQEEFEEQGNAICQAGNERIEEAFTDAGFGEEEPPAEEVEAFVDDELIPSIERQIDELRDLNPPEDVEDDFADLLDDAESALDNVRDMSAEEIVSSEDDPFEDVNERSAELGLTACAEG
jgi:hypothetical protein